MSDETQPGAAVETAAPPVQGGEGSAPSQTDPNVPGNNGAGGVETPEDGRNSSRGIPQGAYRELKGLRQRVKEWEQRYADLEARLPKTPAASEKNSDPDVWTDPDAWFERKQQSAQQKAEIRQKKQEALKFLRSQEDVNADNEDEIAAVVEEKGLMALMDSNPQFAIQLALAEWRKERGIADVQTPDPKKALAKDQARGFAGAAASGGAKVWTAAEVDRITADPAQYAKFGEDIKAAMREGRVR